MSLHWFDAKNGALFIYVMYVSETCLALQLCMVCAYIHANNFLQNATSTGYSISRNFAEFK